MGVEANTTYFIAVSDATGAEGYFDICIENSPEDAIALDVVASDLHCFESNDGSIQITVNNGTGFIDYDWNEDALDGMEDQNTLSIGAYLVTVTDENNCTAQSDSIIISQPDQIFVDLALQAEDNVILYGDTVLAIALPSIDEEAIANTIWSPQQILTNPTSGDFFEQYVSPLSRTELMVMIEDTSGCFAMDSILIAVSKDFPFYIPNAFAPQSANAPNAIFRPFVTNKVKVINFFRIFNRWGDLVYERTNFPIGDTSAGWDGTFNGKLLNSGVFLFFLEANLLTDLLNLFRGM